MGLAAIEPNWQALLVFLAAWLVGCVGLIYLSGSLPLKAAPQAVRDGAGPILVWTNLLALIILAILCLSFAISHLRWTSLIVGGGFVFLFAPFIVQDLPARLKDTKAGLSLLLGCLLAAVALVYLAD